MKGRMISICDVREGRGCARRWTKSQISKPAEESPGFRRPCSTGGGKGDGVGWTRVTVQGGLPWWSSGEDSELSAAEGVGSIPGQRTKIPTCRVVGPKSSSSSSSSSSGLFSSASAAEAAWCSGLDCLKVHPCSS